MARYDDLKEIVKDLGRIQGGSWNAPELDHPTLAPEGLGTVSWPFAFAHEGTPEALSIHPDVATRGAEHLWLEGKGLDLDNSPCKNDGLLCFYLENQQYPIIYFDKQGNPIFSNL